MSRKSMTRRLFVSLIVVCCLALGISHSSASRKGDFPNMVQSAKATIHGKSNDADSHTPITVHLSMSKLPRLDEDTEVTCMVSSAADAIDTSASIILPSDALLVSGNTHWNGPLYAGQYISFSATIRFQAEGRKIVRALARHVIDQENSWGDLDTIYINVGTSRSTKGFFSVEEEIEPNRAETAPSQVVDLKEQSLSPAPLQYVDKGVGIPPALVAHDPSSSSVPPQAEAPTGTLTVTGNWSHYDRGGNLVPSKNFLVQLRRASDGAHLAFAYTDNFGNYSLGPVTNPGTAGVKVRIWTYVKYASSDPTGDELMVVPNGSASDYANSYFGETATSVLSDGTNNVGGWQILRDSPEGTQPRSHAWYIKDDIDRGWHYPPNPVGDCTVEWQFDSTVGTYYIAGEHVHLLGDDRKSPDTIIHEMGHNVMYNVYGHTFPQTDCPSPHYINVSSGTICAWTEGWADFYALAVNGDPVYTWPSGDPLNLETPTWGTASWDSGDKVEGRVAGALWDIYDSTDDGNDHISDGLSHIWGTFSTHTHDRFKRFSDDLITGGVNTSAALDAIYQNTIDYRAAVPTVTSSLTISPAGSSSVGNTLTAQFTITNKGNVAITFTRLVVGGRLNGDNTCAGGCPDFTFANNVTLNPGVSYSYSGTQLMSRAGSYNFYVAYQKTDGNWVTNVPADPGVANTASVTVSNTPTGPNPVVTTSLSLSPAGPYTLGQTISGTFTITNKGNAAITFSRLVIGGRLNNDNTCAGGCPDFTFANNITLNPGASFNYSGTQLMSRAGSYGFYVAYQKTDGSWVTNVPADPGVANTANVSVAQATGTPNPVVTSSLLISPNGPYQTGNTLTAQFTITNKGNAAITFTRLVAGGRLNNDGTCAGGCPDFTFANDVTLNPGVSYNYSGTQLMSRAGSYNFYVAYQKTDGSWVTSVPADPGIVNSVTISVAQAGSNTPNPVVSSSLIISPAGPYFTGNTLTAQFTITNRGNAAITFSRLVAGGRLNNDQTCAGGCPDFSFATGITLNPGGSYNYTGTQLMSRAGSYGFFVAYQKTDGSWVTNVPADPGVANTAGVSVASQTQTQTIAWEFDTNGNSEGWTATNASATNVIGGTYLIDPAGADPFIVGPAISAQASTYQYFVVRMASNGLDSTGAVYFKTQAENFFSEDKKVVFTVSNCSLCGNAGAVRYAVFMSGNAKWTGTITGLRLDPTGNGQAGTNTDSIGIDYIRLSSSSLASNPLFREFGWGTLGVDTSLARFPNENHEGALYELLRCATIVPWRLKQAG
jgi:hypothetical protein